jgi:hypothetical protein
LVTQNFSDKKHELRTQGSTCSKKPQLPITRVYDGQNNKQKRHRASSDNLSEKGENNSAANENVWSHVLDDEVTPLTHTITLNLNLPGKLKTFINQSLLEKSNSKTSNTSLQQF